MKDAARLRVLLEGENSGAKDAIAEADRAAQDLGKSMLATGTAILAGTAVGIKGAMSFEQELRNVNSLAGLTDAELWAIGDTMTQLSIKWGQDSAAMTAGLYDILGAGFDAEEGMILLAAAAEAATAGVTTTDVAADALTSVLNSYANGIGDTALAVEDFGMINDIMFATVDKGKISFDQLGSVIGQNAPLAASLGVSFAELGAAYAMATQQGVSYSEVSTQLNGIMSAFLKPSTAMADALEAAGYASGGALLEAEGLAGALQFLETATGGSKDEMAKLLPNIRALQGATTLLSGDYDEFLTMMENAGPVIDPVTGEIIELGATQAALAETTNTTAFAWSRMMAGISAIASEIGWQLLPVVRFAADGIAALAEKFVGLPGIVKQVVAVLAVASGTILATAGAAVVFGDKLRMFVPALKGVLGHMRGTIVVVRSLMAALLGLSAPILLIIAAVALLAVAWKTNFLGIQDRVREFIGNMKLMVQAFQYAWRNGEAFDAMIGNLPSSLQGLARTGTEALIWLKNLGPLLSTVGTLLGGVFAGDVKTVYNAMRELGLLGGPVGNAIYAIADAVGDLRMAFSTGGLMGVIRALPNALRQMGRAFANVGRELVDRFVRGFEELTGLNLAPLFAGIGAGLDGLNTAFNAVMAVVNAILPSISVAADAFRILLGNGVNPLQAAIGALSIGLGDLANRFPALAGPINVAREAVRSFGDVVRGLIDAFNAMRDGDWGGVFDGILTALQGVLGLMSTMPRMAFELLKAGFAAIDWGGVWDSVTDIASGALEKGGELVSGLLEGAEAFWTGTVEPWLRETGTRAASAIPDLAARLLVKGRQLLLGIYTGVTNFWNETLQPWLRDLATKAVAAIPDLAERLLTKGRQLLLGIYTGVTGFWNETLQPWLRDLAGKAIAAIPDLAEQLLTKGRQLLLGIYSGATAFWNETLRPWLADLAGKAVAAIPDLAERLLTKGRQLLLGIYTGVTSFWEESLKPWLGQLAAKALGAMPTDLGTKLKESGAALLGGFLGGAQEFITGTLVPWFTSNFSVSTITSYLPTDLGSTLKDAGDALIAGFGTGVSEAWDTVTGWFEENLSLSAVTALIPDLSGIPNPLDPIIGFFDGAASTIVDAWTKIKNTLNELKFWGGDGGDGGDAAGTVIEAQAAVGFAAMLQQARDDIVQAGADIETALSNIGTAITTFKVTIGNSGTEAGAAFQKGLTQQFGNAVTNVDTKLGEIGTRLGIFVIEAGAFGKTAGERFQTDLAAGFVKAQQSVRTGLNTMNSYLGTFVTDATTKGRQAGSGFHEGLRAQLNLAISTASTAASRIRGELDFDLYSQGYGIGRSLSSGIADGIRSMTWVIASEAAAVVRTAVSAAQAAGEISSPSKLMAREVGAPLIQGAIVGAQGEAANFRRTLAGIIGDSGSIPLDVTAARRQGAAAARALRSTGNTYVINAVTSSEMARLIEGAESGGSFARQSGAASRSRIRGLNPARSGL